MKSYSHYAMQAFTLDGTVGLADAEIMIIHSFVVTQVLVKMPMVTMFMNSNKYINVQTL